MRGERNAAASRSGGPRSLVAARLAIAASLTWLAVVWIDRPVLGGDTPGFLLGTDRLASCFASGSLVRCGYVPEGTPDGYLTEIGPWPVLQYPIDLVSRLLGAGRENRVNVLVAASVLSAIVALLVARAVVVRFGLAAWWYAFVFVVLSGPLLVYANASWGEMLASALLVLLVAAASLRLSPSLLALAAFLASLTKETAYPFVAALGVLGLLLARRRTGAGIRGHLLWLSGGIGAGIACASLFNVLRFGSAFNTSNFQPGFRTHEIDRVADAAAGLLVAPNGGIVVFWTSAAVLLLALLAQPLVSGSRPRPGAAPALVILAIVGGLTLGLASWWEPFGWRGWGPRLSLPWVLPLVLVALLAYADDLRPFVHRLLAPTSRLLLVAAVGIVLALPHVGFMWRHEAMLDFFAAQSGPCAVASPAGSDGYYACRHERMWHARPMWIDALTGLETPGGAVTGVAVGLGLLGCLVLLRDGTRPAEAQ